MNQLVVITFERADDAQSALAAVRDLEREGKIRLEDTAIVSREPDGRTHVVNELSATTEAGIVVGGLLGSILWFVFPIAGVLIGAAAGALVGSLMDNGVDPKFVDEVKARLTPGRSALFLVIREADFEALVPALDRFHGEVLQTTLDPELEGALREALA
ncbi:MAG: hypothetical protein QOH61_154 [Chloroflexota bacterium]|jgi:uncharacterized membrane protein|nr:hypothetical protein [Chloroflexota bacterium]